MAKIEDKINKAISRALEKAFAQKKEENIELEKIPTDEKMVKEDEKEKSETERMKNNETVEEENGTGNSDNGMSFDTKWELLF